MKSVVFLFFCFLRERLHKRSLVPRPLDILTRPGYFSSGTQTQPKRQTYSLLSKHEPDDVYVFIIMWNILFSNFLKINPYHIISCLYTPHKPLMMNMERERYAVVFLQFRPSMFHKYDLIFIDQFSDITHTNKDTVCTIYKDFNQPAVCLSGCNIK